MAAEPKRSLRRTVASTVEGRSPRFLLGSIVLAMVIALLAGLGIGIKVGEHNKNKTATAVFVRPKATPTTRGTAASTAAKLPTKGVIVKSGAKGLVVTSLKRQLIFATVPLTQIEVTAAATGSDIKAGSHVLFVLDKGAAATATSGKTAKEVIIVSGTAKRRFGTVVFSATPSSMTFKVKGKSVTISTTGAKISTTIPGKKTDLTAGKHVLIRSFLKAAPKKKPRKVFVKRQIIAVEILILPAASAFG